MPNAQLHQLLGRCACPIAICGWACWAGMQDSPDFETASEGVRGTLSAFLCKSSDTDDPLGLQCVDDRSQMDVAEGFHRGCFLDWQLVWGSVAPAVLHKDERAVVGDEVVFEEVVGRAKALFEQAPQASSADL